ncbi:MAG: tripartite tricarboxylate transporter permease [Candidatus Hydrogenedentes bacterium]|nr:tripartite tricarboxylate transporter permease [Candidatus Hydrogenedentota bacterium]
MGAALTQALEQTVGDPRVWAVVIGAAAYGVFVGAIPGLTATMAVALFIPIAYWLDPVPALAAVVTMEACAIFAGDIPNTLLRIPGTPASAAYADDAYGFTKRGQPQRPLGVCLVFSVAGGLFGALVLMLLGHQLARVATMFSVTEYFWLYLFGLSCAVVVSRGSTLKATFGLLIGLLLATVGLSAAHAQARFTFGRPELFQGITFIPAMIGLFGFSEILRNMLTLDKDDKAESNPARGKGALLGPALRLVWSRKLSFARSGSIGSLVGMLPGAGADIGAWVSLAASKRTGRRPANEHERALSGIGDASTANSAALAATWIPALVFGIPGDSITAIVIGVLLMKNVRPGPEIFEKQTALVYSIYFLFILANLVLIPVGFVAIKAGGYVVRIPRRILLPIILLFCVVGSYAINGSYFDVAVMLAMGILGFLLERREVPLGPVVLGIILGGPLEERFVQALSGSEGVFNALFGRPLAAGLGILCIAIWAALVAVNLKRHSAEP